MTGTITTYRTTSGPVLKGHQFRSTKKLHFTLVLPNDLAQQTETLKQTLFSNIPYAEMYRQLIQLGIERFREKHEHESYAYRS